MRITVLEDELAQRTEDEWLGKLPETIALADKRWRILGWTCDSDRDPWAGQVEQRSWADSYLSASEPPERWAVRLLTPTAFSGERAHMVFPLPNLLLGSWLRRWQAFGPILLPDDLVERVRAGLVPSAYRLKTAAVRHGRRLHIGAVGTLGMRALGLKPEERAAVDLLAAYAFWAGSGHHTAQGMGLTRLLPPWEDGYGTPDRSDPGGG